MMNRLRLLLTITDGVDICDKDGSQFIRAARRLRERGVFSLSCGIGEHDVDHERLAILASHTGGAHIVVCGSEGISDAVDSFTRTIVIQRQVQVISTENVEEATIQEQVLESNFAVDAFLLIDCSWSMLGQNDKGGPGDPNKLPRSKEAAKRLVDSLDPRYDRVGVARFYESYDRLARLTTDFELCKRAINGIGGGSSTALFKAMADAVDEFDS